MGQGRPWLHAKIKILQRLKGGPQMSPMTDQSTKFADKSAATANKAFATVEQSTRAVEQSYSISLENIRAFNLKMIDMARTNVEAVLDLSQQIATAKAPSDVVELWTTHARKQFELMSEQSKDLAALAQKMAGEVFQKVS
jgi:phasin